VQRFHRAVPAPTARPGNVPPARTRGRRSDLPVSGSDRRQRSSRRIGARGPGRLVRSRCCARGRGSGQHGCCQHRRRKCPSGTRCHQRPRCRRCAGSQPLPRTILMLMSVHDHYPHPLNTRSHHICRGPAQTLAGKTSNRMLMLTTPSSTSRPERQPTCPRGRRAAWTPYELQSKSHAGKYKPKPQDLHKHEFAQVQGVITAPGARIGGRNRVRDAAGRKD
jgi:hypothetical protein